jgi:hypothetical protein
MCAALPQLAGTHIDDSAIVDDVRRASILPLHVARVSGSISFINSPLCERDHADQVQQAGQADEACPPKKPVNIGRRPASVNLQAGE